LRDCGPDFSIKVAPNGYAWWYVDAISDDGAYALTIIAFIGSVFSPYYKWARRSGAVDPLNHCAINIALYGRKHQRWAMTERSKRFVHRDTARFEVGPSAMRWEDGALIVDIHELGAPIPRRVHGQVRVRPHTLFNEGFALDESGRHRWRPIAPVAHVEVEMNHPNLRWSGSGYFDHNTGDEPLEDAFISWDWSRTHSGDCALIHYDALTKNGAPRELALRFNDNGEIERLSAPPSAPLPKTLWGIDRNVRCELGDKPRIVKTLEDTPFYARSMVQTTLGGQSLPAIHERLRLDRFCAPVVQGMLPFRMPRVS
jgi:carotenoid 1,2-hydratase